MIRILSKSSISKYIITYLSKAKRGNTKINLWEIVSAILYKFKSGVQWHLLPIKSLIYRGGIKFLAVFYHFRKWTLDGSWQRAFENLLKHNKSLIDLSIGHFDGTHSLCKKGGKEVAYQGRKKGKTSNTLWLVDNQGLPVGFCPPIAGNHHDIYDSEKRLFGLKNQLQKSDISLNGLFINMDAGFDSKELRNTCEKLGIIVNAPANKRNSSNLDELDYYFDELLYKQRYKVERTNSWMDSNRTFLIRQDTSIESWTAWHYIFALKSWINLL